MKKALLAILTTILALVVVKSQDLTLQQILDGHFKAVGQDKLVKINTIKLTGKLETQGMEFPFTVYLKRPNKMRVEAEVMGSTMVQAFNGTTGYMIAPWTGSMDPADVNEEQLKDFKKQANMDDELFEYDKKGDKLEVVGTEDLDGNKHYKLKFTAKPEAEGAEGDVTYYFIDSKTFLISKTVSERNFNGSMVEVEEYQSNYKPVEGVSMAFTSETKAQGNTVTKSNIETITFNEDVKDEIFEKPVKN